jgi:(p)ppGpp synthase/HD superfamily hydrolase
MDLVKSASLLALALHYDQKDKAGMAYIMHPRRVAMAMSGAGHSPEVVAAAWLHDAVEDTWVTVERIRAAFGDEVATLVDLLTRQRGVHPVDYYAAIRANPYARAIKLADIEDNMRPWRLTALDAETRTRLTEKYTYALQELAK